MSDNLYRYRAIRDALTQWEPGEPTGNRARHLTTLVALLSGGDSGIAIWRGHRYNRVWHAYPLTNKPWAKT